MVRPPARPPFGAFPAHFPPFECHSRPIPRVGWNAPWRLSGRRPIQVPSLTRRPPRKGASPRLIARARVAARRPHPPPRASPHPPSLSVAPPLTLAHPVPVPATLPPPLRPCVSSRLAAYAMLQYTPAEICGSATLSAWKFSHENAAVARYIGVLGTSLQTTEARLKSCANEILRYYQLCFPGIIKIVDPPRREAAAAVVDSPGAQAPAAPRQGAAAPPPLSAPPALHRPSPLAEPTPLTGTSPRALAAATSAASVSAAPVAARPVGSVAPPTLLSGRTRPAAPEARIESVDPVLDDSLSLLLCPETDCLPPVDEDRHSPDTVFACDLGAKGSADGKMSAAGGLSAGGLTAEPQGAWLLQPSVS